MNKSEYQSQVKAKTGKNLEGDQAKNGLSNKGKGQNLDNNSCNITDNTPSGPAIVLGTESDEDMVQASGRSHIINKRNLKSYQKRSQKQKCNDQMTKPGDHDAKKISKSKSHELTDCTDKNVKPN